MTDNDIYEQYCKLQEYITDRLNELGDKMEEHSKPQQSVDEYSSAHGAYQELNRILTKSNKLLED